MKDFIKALYADLLHRIDVVLDDIRNSNYHDDIRHRFIAETISQFSELRAELQAAFDTGVLDDPLIARNNIFKFNRLDREFKAIHSYRYLALKNYKDPEIFFFLVISQIYSEHRISAIPPIVSTISNHDYYYWAVPYFEIIALPSGEENSLLNLPDMYHEIGHLLHSMFNGKSCELSSQQVETHFEQEAVRVVDEGMPRLVEIIEEAKYLWQTAWMEEFTCDLVGTYMTGGAYAWTNLKLLSTGHGSTKIYEHNQSHPADEARMRIIIIMLDKLGLTAEKAEMEQAWQMFLKDTQAFMPGDYALLYPQKLLQMIVDEFFAFYQNADLASYPELSSSGHSIAGLLNDAWYQAQHNPLQYFSYETKAIEALRKRFGI